MNRLIYLIWLVGLLQSIHGTPTSVSFPSLHSGNGSGPVHSNFFGISIELSTINTLIGENETSIPGQIESYLWNIQTRTKNPVRIRIGGNSIDDSVFNYSQPEMIVRIGQAMSAHDQPVSYGPVLFDTLEELGNRTGGARYLLGLSLLLHEENDTPLIVWSAERKLSNYLDGFLLGNEPDLYGPNGRRQSNYSVQDYLTEFSSVAQQLNSSTQYGDLTQGVYIGGPTICCNWALADILSQGYLPQSGSRLKYINLQHYPQTSCFGENGSIDYYTSHHNVVELAEWQMDGINLAKAANKQVTLGEFNTASCGGFPGVSDTFAATLWTLDYVLQLASVGYDAAYIHTRERGVTYNLFDPSTSNDTDSVWTTFPPYYALLSAAEALSAGWQNESFVLDLKLDNNSDSRAGYGIYDGQTNALNTLVFLNYAEAGQDSAVFSISASENDAIFVRTLTAPNLMEKYNISWAGKTFNGVGDGIMTPSGFAEDTQVACNVTCDFTAPSPGAVVVWFDFSLVPTPSDFTSPQSTNHGSSSRYCSSGYLYALIIPSSLAVLALLS